MKYLIVQGSPVDGLWFTGPFETQTDAADYGDSVESDWWVADLTEPEATE